MTLRRAELQHILELHPSFTGSQARRFLEDFFELICRELERGNPVKLPGFGAFVLRQKPVRPGRNPKTGQEVAIAARRVVTFRPSAQLKSAMARPATEPHAASADRGRRMSALSGPERARRPAKAEASDH